jgi:hypothetical protein
MYSSINGTMFVLEMGTSTQIAHASLSSLLLQLLVWILKNYDHALSSFNMETK